MRERRTHPRHDVTHRGMLSFDNGLSTVPCQLVNLSTGGALVRVSATQTLPQMVSLFYDKLDEQVPEVASALCTVVRREPRAAALKFLRVV
ncbi:MAG: PilZ domain-containing protein [Devosia sp.]|uniref:PilZ domain-containing protein n=1 Tax=Devosia sp. 66-22 TaxID=1895753 RepID=UPI000A71CACE|nr:PilZ domain-containing protein [Devosia sp. 66-22]MBN9348011.1 PilZ domain-containing protein [Devosia sp.]